MKKRPSFIRHWSELEAAVQPPGTDEMFGYASEFALAADISHLRMAHFRIPPGMRAYPPLAARSLEIFMFVLEGRPDLWIDGRLHRLRAGDGVCLAARTGIAHSVINNSDSDVRIFVMSEAFPRAMQVVHPIDRAAAENLKNMGMHWDDAPRRKLGPNSGRPGDLTGRSARVPAFVSQWRKILEKKSARYPNSIEDQGIDAKFGKRARFSRIGVHVEVLKPGRRTSYPHAERDEDEFVYVVSGKIDCWLDGDVYPMGEGEFVGWEAGTGITHVIMNNSNDDAILLVGGEASRSAGRCWYPFHPHRKNEMGANFWADHPIPKLGPHDGLPDALRELVPAKARKSAMAANAAILKLKSQREKSRK